MQTVLFFAKTFTILSVAITWMLVSMGMLVHGAMNNNGQQFWVGLLLFLAFLAAGITAIHVYF